MSPKFAIGVAFTSALITGPVHDATACEYASVRDAAFTERRDVHRLCVITWSDDPRGKQVHDSYARWFAENGEGLNVELAPLVAADDPEIDWPNQFGIPFAPTRQQPMPAVVLVGRRGSDDSNFVIAGWHPPPAVDELVTLRTSPARQAIRDEALRRIAVVLYVPGTDEHSGQVQPIIDSVVRTWSAKEPAGIGVVRVDRSDERERLLLSFCAVPPSGPDWLAVVFGRGKFLSTPDGKALEGERITEDQIDALIDAVMADCTCSRPARSLGVDVPMVWDESFDERVVWLYDEGDVTAAIRQDAPADADGQTPSAHDPAFDPAPTATTSLRTTTWTLAGLALIVSMAAVILLWGKRRLEQ